jgi:hypothetical protein
MLADLPREVVPLKSHHNSAGTIDEPFGWRDVLEQEDLQPRGGWGNSASATFLIVPRSDSCTGIHRECIAHLRANLQRQLVWYRRELFAHSIGVVGPLHHRNRLQTSDRANALLCKPAKGWRLSDRARRSHGHISIALHATELGRTFALE